MRGGAPVSPRLPPRQLFVVVARAADGMRMRLAPADLGVERFAVENGGLGIAALEHLGSGDRSALTEVYHVFRGLDLRGSAAQDRLEIAFAAWQRALEPRGIDLRLEHEALYGAPLPRHSWAAGAGGISLRPWDIELTALAARLRQIVKLDRVPADFVGGLKNNAEQRGLLVEVVTPRDAAGDESITLILSRDRSTLAEGRDLEQRLLVRGGDPSAGGAAQRMGELLGYPSCCVRRFAQVAEHNDTTLAWALLPPPPGDRASPFTQWLQPGLALLSHSPCELSCPASVSLGERLLDAVDAAEPGFAARWRALAGRVQVVDQGGNRLALAVDGFLAEEAVITDATLLEAGAADPHGAPRTAELVGMPLRCESAGLTIAERDWYAPYVADHRG